MSVHRYFIFFLFLRQKGKKIGKILGKFEILTKILVFVRIANQAWARLDSNHQSVYLGHLYYFRFWRLTIRYHCEICCTLVK